MKNYLLKPDYLFFVLLWLNINGLPNMI